MQKSLWSDCDGGVITAELILVSSVLVASLLTGLGSYRASIEKEFAELGQVIEAAGEPVLINDTGVEKAKLNDFEGETFDHVQLSEFLN